MSDAAANKALEVFKAAKYGLFIHWGLYSILAGEFRGRTTPDIAEWIMHDLNISVEDYEPLAKRFNPRQFDAESYVRQAKAWGMRYIVFTAKHHDGFAMYRSGVSAYNVVDATPFKRDILKELQLACEKYGMKLGIYYSQAQDWHDPNGLWDGRDSSGRDFKAYLHGKALPQIRELLTNYGNVFLMWFDTPLDMSEGDCRLVYETVKKLQPDCLVSGRIGHDLGDYATTSDNFIPLLPQDFAWEVPATLNETWGYKKTDQHWKSADDIIRKLLKINSRGGNYLLNVGPDADGVIPPQSYQILDKVSAFLERRPEAIFGTAGMPFYPYDLSWCVFTHNRNRLYVHIVEAAGRFEISSIENPVVRVRDLETGRDLSFTQRINGIGIPMWDLLLDPDSLDHFPYTLEIELEGERLRIDERIQ